MPQGYSLQMAELKHPSNRIRILLGGGIASGKSVAGGRLAHHGVTVVEADRLGHSVLEADGEAFELVSERWHSVVDNQRIDRRALAEIVFSDPGQLAELAAMTHPPIVRRINEFASMESDLVVEIPLILDVPGDWMRVIVDADENLRVRRGIERGGNEADVRRRMASQPDRAEWMAWADEIMDNNGSADDLKKQVDDLWHGLRATSHGRQT